MYFGFNFHKTFGIRKHFFHNPSQQWILTRYQGTQLLTRKKEENPEEKMLSIYCVFKMFSAFAISLNHRAVWIRMDLKNHLVPNSLPWAGTPSPTPGF